MFSEIVLQSGFMIGWAPAGLLGRIGHRSMGELSGFVWGYFRAGCIPMLFEIVLMK